MYRGLWYENIILIKFEDGILIFSQCFPPHPILHLHAFPLKTLIIYQILGSNTSTVHVKYYPKAPEVPEKWCAAAV